MHKAPMETLAQYLDRTQTSQAVFGERIGASQSSVSRFCAGHRPSSPMIQRIFDETGGAVVPAVWFVAPAPEAEAPEADAA